MSRYKRIPVNKDILTAYMQEHNMTQADLARATQLSQSSVSEVLKEGEASIGIVAILEQAMGIPIR